MKENSSNEDDNLSETSPQKEVSFQSNDKERRPPTAGSFENLTKHSCYCLANIMAQTNVRFHTVNHFTSPRSLNSSLHINGSNVDNNHRQSLSPDANTEIIDKDKISIENKPEEELVDYIVQNGDALLMESEKIKNKNRIRRRDLEEREKRILSEFMPASSSVIVNNSNDELMQDLSSARSSSSDLLDPEQRKHGLLRKKKIWRKQYEKNRNNHKENFTRNNTLNRNTIEMYPSTNSPTALEIHNNYFNLAAQQSLNHDTLTSPLSNDHPHNGYWSDNDNNSNNSIVLPSGRGKPRKNERKINVDKVGEMLDEAQTKLEALLDEVSPKE